MSSTVGNSENQKPELDQSFRDKIATVDESGNRNWIYAKKPKGRYYNKRNILSYVLLGFLFLGPWLRIGGEPLLMLDVLGRKFIILGQVFWPQDFHLAVFAFIIGLVFIIVFTVAFGRIFCGWFCPQTIFMEMVFRKIEYWIEGDWQKQKLLDAMPWNKEKIIKKSAKHLVFFGIAILISNTFLAYIIGSERLLEIQLDNPKNHLAGLGFLLLFSAVFYGVFARFREQVCIAVCPYGRLQGVLLDRNSLVVAYDYVRGEIRGAFRGKREDRKAAGKGDCIDCHACVDVCPTGIDIRNGTQLECVNCTACIDACDAIMDKVNLQKGLIRYASENSIADKKPFVITKRLAAYIGVLTVLLIVFAALLFTRTDVEAILLRTPGQMFQTQSDGRISNLYNVKIINKTNRNFPVDIQLKNFAGEIKLIGSGLEFGDNNIAEGSLFIITEKSNLDGLKTNIKLQIISNGEVLEEIKTNFLGPH